MKDFKPLSIALAFENGAKALRVDLNELLIKKSHGNMKAYRL
jgi:hypothetical protein